MDLPKIFLASCNFCLSSDLRPQLLHCNMILWRLLQPSATASAVCDSTFRPKILKTKDCYRVPMPMVGALTCGRPTESVGPKGPIISAENLRRHVSGKLSESPKVPNVSYRAFRNIRNFRSIITAAASAKPDVRGPPFRSFGDSDRAIRSFGRFRTV